MLGCPFHGVRRRCTVSSDQRSESSRPGAYVGKSHYNNQGQRAVARRCLVQSANDIFLGYARGKIVGRDFCMRQLHDMKIEVMIEGMEPGEFKAYAEICGRGLARAHARSATLRRFQITSVSNAVFDDAIVEFAVVYADQKARDYKAIIRAIRDRRL